jgi:GWxTD domain-containing protein
MKAARSKSWLLVLLLVSCGSPKYQDGYSTVETYTRNRSRVRHMNLFVEHQFHYVSDTETTLHFKLNSTDFYADGLSKESTNYHRVLVEFGLYTSPAKRRPLGEQQQLFEFGKDTVLFGALTTYHPVIDSWYEIQVTDLHTKTKTTLEGWLYKEKKPNEYNILLREESTGLPILNRYAAAEHIRVECNRCPDKLYVLRYDKLQFNAPPAFVTEGYLPNFGVLAEIDSIMIRNRSGVFRLDSTETVLISPEATPKNGVVVFRTTPSFPLFGEIGDLLPCMKYICSKEEYQSLLNSENQQAAFEYFWLKIARDKVDLAQQLAKQYFARVTYANRHFNSYKPGWMTDRGMIYIVFGPPDHIDRASHTETWTYGVPYQFNSLNLVFDKENHFQQSNDFTLRRHDYLRVYWYQTVEQWRNGFVQGP